MLKIKTKSTVFVRLFYVTGIDNYKSRYEHHSARENQVILYRNPYFSLASSNIVLIIFVGTIPIC